MSTKIEWTDETWNPVTGCTKVSQGCKNCYAERLAPKVFAGQKMVDHHVELTAPLPPRPRRFTDVLCHPERLDQPLRWARPRRIFVNSMSDLFHEDVPDEFIDKVFAAMAFTPRHTFQILTKRPDRMRAWSTKTGSGATRETVVAGAMDFPDWLPHVKGRSFPRYPAAWPLPNVWLGVSVEDQATADERIPLLLKTPAAVRFVSYEPALGPVDFTKVVVGNVNGIPCHVDARCGLIYSDATGGASFDNTGRLHWIITGGESGPGARPAHPDWFRFVRDQCAAAGIAFFFKQWGNWLPDDQVGADGTHCQDAYDPEEKPDAFYDWPGSKPMRYSVRIPKKDAGRQLDGRTHDEYP